MISLLDGFLKISKTPSNLDARASKISLCDHAISQPESAGKSIDLDGSHCPKSVQFVQDVGRNGYCKRVTDGAFLTPVKNERTALEIARLIFARSRGVKAL